MLLQIEQECLDVYKRKVAQAAKSRAELLQALSDAQLELSTLVSALGDKSFGGIVSNHLILSFVQNSVSWIPPYSIGFDYSLRRHQEQSRNNLPL